MPILYAGFAGITYALVFNQGKYSKYRDAYKLRLDSDPDNDNLPEFSKDNLNTLQDYYHRFRDLSVIGFSVLYVLNIIDASVDAHLFKFDVSDELSVKMSPYLYPSFSSGKYCSGLTLVISK